MTDAELKKLDRTKLTQSQQTALKVIENAREGKQGFFKLVQYIIDRDEGKAVQRQEVTDIGKMTLADALQAAHREKELEANQLRRQIVCENAPSAQGRGPDVRVSERLASEGG